VLVLTRKIGEAIMIGEDVQVTILSSDGLKIRLGIEAPSEVPVHRKEVYVEIQAQEGRTLAAEEPGARARRGRAP
jgi:carbon storage regulator